MTEKNVNPYGELEETINAVITNETLKNALDFVDYMKANDLVVNGVEISYKGKAVCYMHLDGNKDYPSPWTIWTEGDYSNECEDVPVDESMKEIAWANINICGDCGAGCSPGKLSTIFGKEFDKVCNAAMAFHMPDAKTLECVKKLLKMRKNNIIKDVI